MTELPSTYLDQAERLLKKADTIMNGTYGASDALRDEALLYARVAEQYINLARAGQMLKSNV